MVRRSGFFGYEGRVAKSCVNIKIHGMEDMFGEVWSRPKKWSRCVAARKRQSERKFSRVTSGQMVMKPQAGTWVRNVPRVMGFIGVPPTVRHLSPTKKRMPSSESSARYPTKPRPKRPV